MFLLVWECCGQYVNQTVIQAVVLYKDVLYWTWLILVFSFILTAEVFEEVEAEDDQEEEYTSEDVTTVEFSVIAPIVQNQQQVCRKS